MQIVADSVAKLKSQQKAPLIQARRFGMPINIRQQAESFVQQTLQAPTPLDRRGKGSYPVAKTETGAVVYSDGTVNNSTPEQLNFAIQSSPLAKALADVPTKITPMRPASGQWNTYQPTPTELGASPTALGQRQTPLEAKAVKEFTAMLNQPNKPKATTNQTYLQKLKEKIDTFLDKFPMAQPAETNQPITMVPNQGLQNVVYQAVQAKKNTLIPVTNVSANSVTDPIEQYRGLIAKVAGGLI